MQNVTNIKINVSLMVHLYSAFPFGVLKSAYIKNDMAEITGFTLRSGVATFE